MRDTWLTRATLEQLGSWKTRIWATLLAIVALVLCQLPLFSVLGFEFSFVIAIVGSLAGADLGASLVWRARTMKASKVARSLGAWQALWQCVRGAVLLSNLILLPPLAIVSIAGIWVRNCDWLFGLRCFVLMPMLSATIASTMGVLAAIVIGPRRWLCRALPFVILLTSTLVSLAHFYTAPAVFSYNPFAGYFPGNLYDESIDLRAPFYWARLFHLSLLATAAFLVALWLHAPTLLLRRKLGPTRVRWREILGLIAAASLALLLYLQSGTLGFSVDEADVKAALAGRYESEHFIIHYPANPEISEQIEVIAAEHEFRRAQLVRDLGVDPRGKITSFYFESPDQKHKLMGARNVYMAKPWRHEIYLNHQGFPHQVLRHEIAHVMAGSFGDPIFEVSAGRLLGLPVFFNIGLIEGIAVASDWPDHFNKPLTPHQSVKAMAELGMPLPVNRLFSTGFLSMSSARSYTLAGSYLRFLLDRYGIEKLRRLYENGGDFRAAYGMNQATLDAQWQQVIEATELPKDAAQIIEERFRSKAIFGRPCPHAIARAREAMAKDAAAGDLEGAIDTARHVCDQVPAEPRYQLQLASLLQHDKQANEARKIYTQISGDKQGISSTLRAHALFALTALAMDGTQPTKALELLNKILGMPLGDDDRRRAGVMRQVLTHQGPAAAPLQEIFWPGQGKDIDRLLLVGLAAEATLLEPTLGIGHYLLARQLRGRGSPPATLRALRRALALPLAPLVEREAARLLAEAAFLAEDYDALHRAATILVRPEQPEVTRLLGYDWLERATWAKTGTLPPLPLGWQDGTTRSGMP